MARLRSIDLSGVVGALPEPVAVLDKACIQRNGELFICALGFEDRAVSVAVALAGGGSRFDKVCLIEYDTNRQDNDVNRGQLVECLNKICPDVCGLHGDDAAFFEQLKAAVDGVPTGEGGRPPRVTIDISVLANRVLMASLQVLIEADIELTILYSEADSYHPTTEEYARDPAAWKSEQLLGLERGVADVLISPTHGGQHLDPLPDCVILFPGFRAERSHAVIGKIDPSLLLSPGRKVVWLLGVPHLEADRWRLAAMREINAISSARECNVSTFDYREALRTLESVYEEFSEGHNITLAPMGSKNQGLGCALFCYMHPDVRIVVTKPKEYNARCYSHGCKGIWNVDFGPMSVLRGLLNSVGKLVLEG